MRTFALAEILVAGAVSSSGQSVSIVENGKARMPLVVADAKDPVAAELQRVVRKISGAELKLAGATPSSRGVYLGAAPDFPWLGLAPELAGVGPEGFRSGREDVPDAAEIEKLWAETRAWL